MQSEALFEWWPKCNFLYNLSNSFTFKLEGVPNLNDPHLPEIESNSPIPHSPIVIKIIFFQIHTYYILFDSKFNADEILQRSQWLKNEPRVNQSIILKKVTKMDQKEAIW